MNILGHNIKFVFVCSALRFENLCKFSSRKVEIHKFLMRTLVKQRIKCINVYTFPVDDVVSIFITKESGERIASLVDNGTRVVMSISVGPLRYSPFNSINRTSVLFVSTSFIVLMVISLAWLVFYYIQRFRYSHSKDRVLVSC